MGEKATGTVTIFNRSSSPLTLKSGAIMVSETGGGGFVITETVTVASKSADLLSGKEEFGKKEGVPVRAQKIGPEFNLSKSTTFSVDNYSKTIAYSVAEADFTGGTSRAAKAVDKKDLETLLTQATEKIKKETQEKLSAQDKTKGVLVLNDLQFSQKKFNHNLGDEADDVSLDLAGSIDVLVYTKSDLFDLTQKELQSQLPLGKALTAEKTEIKLAEPVRKDSYFLVKVVVNAQIFSSIDQDKYVNIIKGKKLSDAKVIIQNIQGFDSVLLSVNPALPIISKIYLPLNNLKIVVTPK